MTSAPATVVGWMLNDPSGSKVWPSPSSSAIQDTPSSRTPSPDISAMQQQPYYRTESHSSTTSERRAQRNRARDPSWVPRPPNAFIIFRAEYSRKHAQANKDTVKTPEKTLSKRAAEAWKALSASEREPYKSRAEEERKDHAKKHPHYRYKPQRRQSDGQRGIISISRREQVESLVRRAAMRSSSESESASDCTSPSSPVSLAYSSPSPEPLDTPFRDNSPTTSTRFEGRSSSMPSRLSAPPLHHQFEHSLLLSGYSGASDAMQFSGESFDGKSRLYMDHSSQYADPNPFAWPIEPLDAGFNLWSGAQGAELAQPSSASSLQSAPGAFMYGSSNMPAVAGFPGLRPPATMSSVTSPAAGSPLLRRRRAATTSGAFPSPLTVVSSSLANWNQAPVPTVAITGASPTTERLPTPPMQLMPPQTYVLPESQQSTDPGMWPPEAFSAGPGTMVQGVMVDYDRTPKTSDFPGTVHTGLLPQVAGMTGMPLDAVGDAWAWQGTRQFDAAIGTYDADADFQSYAIGLQDLGIPAGSYGTSHMPDVDLNEFFNFEGDTQGC